MTRISLLLLTALLGIALLTLSFPRLRASIVFLPVETALRNHWGIRPISQDRFPSLIDAARSSLEIHETDQYWQGLGWMQYLYGISLGYDTEQAKGSFLLARQAFETELKSSPAQPAEWLRLGWIYALLRYPSQEVIEAWNMSVYTGRVEHHLLLNRLELGLRYADFFDEDDLALLRDQLLLAWQYKRREMKKAIASGTVNLKTIRGLIYRDRPEILEEMEEALEKHH